MIIGLGSVGTYLLDFLVSKNDSAIKLVVVGRNQEKMQSDGFEEEYVKLMGSEVRKYGNN